MRKLTAAGCTSIDFLCVNCADCTQQTWTAAVSKISRITGKDSYRGFSLTLLQTPGITSLGPLEGITGLLSGGVLISGMGGLIDLEGLHNIKGVGSDSSAGSVTLYNNKRLLNVMALGQVSFALSQLVMTGNSEALCKVPNHWPEKDKHRFPTRSKLCSKEL
jgi:hypothetical protein